MRCPLPSRTHILAACVLACLPARAWAEPTLRVRAQVTLELHVSGREPGLRIEGSLSDDLGARLTNRSLHVSFRGAGVPSAHARPRVIRTDARGHFSLNAPCSGCSATVELATDPFYEHASATVVVALERPALSLDFLEPSELAVS